MQLGREQGVEAALVFGELCVLQHGAVAASLLDVVEGVLLELLEVRDVLEALQLLDGCDVHVDRPSELLLSGILNTLVLLIHLECLILKKGLFLKILEQQSQLGPPIKEASNGSSDLDQAEDGARRE